jgi:branched-chain amino acid transport system permease protein
MSVLRTIPRRPLIGALVSFALFAIAASLYATGGPAARHIAMVMVINGVMVVATQIFVGNTGILSFGHVGLAGLAAYITAILSTPTDIKSSTIGSAPLGLAGVQIPVWSAVIIAVVVTTLIAALIGIFMSRLNGIAASIVTLAILVVVNAVLINWKSLTGGSEAFYGIQVKTTLPWALGALLVTVVAARLFSASRAGLRARASREDEVAARSMGVSVNRSRYVSWVLSTVFVSLGGALIAHLLGAISPSEFYENLMFVQIAMLVLGGMFSVTGALLGTVIVTVLSEVLRYLGDGPTIGSLKLPMIVGLSSMAYGAIILIMMVWRPAGIMADREIDGLWDRLVGWRRKTAPDLAAAVPGPPGPAPAVPPGGPAASAVAVPAGASAVVSAAAAATPALPPPPAGPPLLAVNGVTMLFAGLRAVDNASIGVYPGEILGLIGPNGAGKTTLLNMISGLYTCTSGSITLRGQEIAHLPSFEIARLGVGRTFQNTHLFRELTVRENVETAARVAQQYRPTVYRPTDEILSQFGLQEVSRRRAGTLPYGVQRQVEIARAVALGPDLLLLDEPAAGANEMESDHLMDTVRTIRDLERCAILLIDHDLPFVLNLCERLYVLDAGRVIAEGTAQEIQDDPQVKEAYLGTRTSSRRGSTARSISAAETPAQ